MLLCITLTQKNLKLRNFLALALVCTPFMLLVIDFFNKINPQCLHYLTDFLLLGVLWVVRLMIFLWFYWELCILFLDPFLYGFFFHKSWSPLAVL